MITVITNRAGMKGISDHSDHKQGGNEGHQSDHSDHKQGGNEGHQ